MRITWKRAAVALLVLVVLGFAGAWSGIVNVGASTGHAAITDWFLHFAMRSSVRTHAALGVPEPPADPTGLVSAAGHFAAHCAVCHGSPAEPASPVMQSQTPPPPDLRGTAGTWSDEQLFWIIKHGVKFTAMPAWPALERDDEIRRMAAFVRRLPDMTAEEYRALAYGPEGEVSGGTPPTSFESALADCERCHADDGRGQHDIPVLAGQKRGYLLWSLERFAAGERDSGVMQAAAARVDRPLLAALAEHYSGFTGLGDGRSKAAIAASIEGSASGDDVAARVAAHGLPEADLPACASCHAPGKRPHYPRLHGQKPEYLAGRLRRWRREDAEAVEPLRDNDTMPVIARRIPEDLIEPLARYLSGAAP